MPRGGNSTKSYTTTNLVNHLSTKHLEVNVKYIKRKASKEAQPPRETRKRSIERQLSLKETQELTRPWDINDNKSQCVHKRIGKMLAIDYQPLSMVEDNGFTRVETLWASSIAHQLPAIASRKFKYTTTQTQTRRNNEMELYITHVSIHTQAKNGTNSLLSRKW